MLEYGAGCCGWPKKQKQRATRRKRRLTGAPSVIDEIYYARDKAQYPI